MPKDYKLTHTRREFLSASVTVPATLAFASVLGIQTQVPEVRATPACGEGGARTPAQTEGPYFKPTSPLRTSLLEPGMPGTRIVVEGAVLTTDCRPMPQALVDFWQADDRGSMTTPATACVATSLPMTRGITASRRSSPRCTQGAHGIFM